MKTLRTLLALSFVVCISASQVYSDDEVDQARRQYADLLRITFQFRDDKGEPVVGVARGRGRTFDSDEFRVAYDLKSLEKYTPLHLFRHAERHIGGFAEVTKDSPPSQEVKLTRLGSLNGRLIDERQRPMNGKRIKVFVMYKTRLVWDTPTAIVKEDGTFTVTGLIPGLTYSPYIHGGANLNPFSEYQLKAGETKDLGVVIRKVKAKTFLGVATSNKGIVLIVFPSSPAEDAGIVRGDKIVRFDGNDVAGFEELQANVARRQKGDKVDVEVVRGGKHRTLKVVLSGD